MRLFIISPNPTEVLTQKKYEPKRAKKAGKPTSYMSDAKTDLSAPPVDVLVIGHVTRDLIGQAADSDYRVGGTVSFAAVTALRLGRRPTILTSAQSEADLAELPPGVELHILPSEATTTFANVYNEHGRIQYSYAQAETITADAVTIAMRKANAVLLGPLVNEIPPDVAGVFTPETLVAAVPQGWMRRWDETGRIYSIPWETESEILPNLDALILSEEDIDRDLSRLDQAFQQVPLVVVTEYRDGSRIYQRCLDGASVDGAGNATIREIQIPPRPAKEVDPTGAGDVFATAFMLRYQETGDAIQSARFANVTASFGVEAEGVTGIPTREKVLAYMQDHPFQE